MYILYVGFGAIIFAFVFSYWISKLFSYVFAYAKIEWSPLAQLFSMIYTSLRLWSCVCVSLFLHLCIRAVVFFVYLAVSKLSRPHSRSHFPRALICIFAATLTLSYIYNTSHFLQQHNTEYSVYELTLTLSYIYNTSHCLQQHNTEHSVYEPTLTPHLHLQQHHLQPGPWCYDIFIYPTTSHFISWNHSLSHFLHNTSLAPTPILTSHGPSYHINPYVFFLLCLPSVSAIVSFIVFGSETWRWMLRSHLYLCIPCLCSQQELHR